MKGRLAGGCVLTAALAVLAAAQTQNRIPEDAYRANNLGVAYLEQYDYAAAVTHLRTAVATSADLAIARLNLALALFYSGEFDAARREAEAARRALPDRPHPHYVLGLIAREADRPAEALAHFQEVRKVDADDVGTAINMGQIHLQEGRYPEAREAFSRAVKAEPYNVTAAYGLATALIRGGARDEGTAAMQRFQQLRDSGYAITYSRNYLEQGRYAEALSSTGAEAELVDERQPDVEFRVHRPGGIEALERTGAVTLDDIDKDGDLDVFVGHRDGLRLLKNDSGRLSDATATSGLDKVAADAVVAGDFDNDGLTDVCVLFQRGIALFRQGPSGRFNRVDARGLDYPAAAAVAGWLDVDHDGDLDLYVGGASGEAPTRLFQNNGNGTFGDISAAARLTGTGPVAALVATDYDNRRDIDLLIGPADRPPLLFQNRRDGTFGEVAASVGLDVPGAAGPVAAGDVNKDGFTDFFFGGAIDTSLALSNGRGSFVRSKATDDVRGARAAQFLDYDNDGLLDLVAATRDGIAVVRNLGARWVNVSAGAVGGAKTTGDAGIFSLAAGDLDGDGDVDLVTGGERLTIWRNEGGNRHRSIRVQLAARVSNRTAAGAKVEIRAGSLLQKLETYTSSPAPAPAHLVFGLGGRSRVDVARVLWPAGILQAEIPARVDPPQGLPAAIRIEELDRKPSSCPYLYTWSGERFEFLTDFLGGGEMGYWLAPGLR